MLPVTIPEPVKTAALTCRYPLLFAVVSGAHLYGFSSPDSDRDLRSVQCPRSVLTSGFRHT